MPDNQAANDQTLAQAVNEMLSGSEQPQANPVAPTVQPPAANEPQAPMANVNPTPQVNPESNNSSVDISGKKVIQPLNNTAPQKSLEELVAQEEANNITSNPVNPQTTTPKPFDPSDPNNVAL